MQKHILIFMLIFAQTALLAQSKIEVTVLGDGEKALDGATVDLQPSGQRTATNEKGYAAFEGIKPGSYHIRVSYVGFRTVRKPVQVEQGRDIELAFSLKRTEQELLMVEVNERMLSPVRRTGDALYTGTTLTRKGIEDQGVAATTGVYNSLAMLPGIHVEKSDGLGIGKKSVRIRGVKGYFGGMTVEGVPNYGIMPIGPRDAIYDMENVRQISLYKGATPADLGTGTGNKAGAVELRFKRPKDDFGVQASQYLGSNKLMRTFARVDAGRLPLNSRLFASYSYAKSAKWKGAGTMGPRHHATAGYTVDIGDRLDVTTFYNFNQMRRHFFRSLNYQQAKKPASYADLAYHESLSGNPAEDLHYYDYNGGDFTNHNLLALANYESTGNWRLKLKGYWNQEDADFLETGVRGTPDNRKYMAFNKVRDLQQGGLITEIAGKLGNLNYTAGYWLESFKLNKSVLKNAITPDGLVDKGYRYYDESKGRGVIHSPFLKISQESGKFSWQAGLKYFYYAEPETQGFRSTAGGSPEPDPLLHLNRMKYARLLPTAGIGYSFSQNAKAYLNYGRNYMRPYAYVPVTNLFADNTSTFTEAGMSLQDVFNQWEMETSDHVDLGLHYRNSGFFIKPSVFYARHHDVLTPVFDPVVGLNYYQNTGEMNAYGAELLLTWQSGERWVFFGNFTYNRMTFASNLKRKTAAEGTQTIPLKGNQIPATPELLFKSGATWSFSGLTISPGVRYVGSRYSDALNQQSLPGYWVFDARLGYDLKTLIPGFRRFALTAELNNLTDNRYIGRIAVSDDTQSGGAAFYAGMPFNAVFSLAVSFE